ncbi:MAG: PHP domain-containing protein [Syntrophomonas sp.]
MQYDLHVHTTASDGVLSPPEVIDKAIAEGLRGIAITDHDTVDGLEPALSYQEAGDLPITVIPGIEMNTESDGQEIHILGYYIDYHNLRLKGRLQEIREARRERAEKMIIKLRGLGMLVSFKQVENLAKGDLIGRPHIAQALVEKKYVYSIKEAFEKYIGRGKPAYVSRYKFLPQEAVDLIKKAGGVTVLAHPGLIKNLEVVSSIIKLGIEGIEVFYPEHSDRQINQFTELCRKNRLLITGGSDYHGNGNDESRNRLGCSGIKTNQMEKIIKYHNMAKEK